MTKTSGHGQLVSVGQGHALEEGSMSFEEIMGSVMKLAAATDALGAIGARASLVLEGKPVDPHLTKALDEVAGAAGVTGIDTLAPHELGALAGLARMFVREADIQVADPGRAPRWNYTDPIVLEGWGRGSSMMPQLIASSVPEAGEVTSFLDVGVGVGWLAIAAAQQWPGARVVGIDVWEPSLDRARKHVAESGLDGRVEVRNQDVSELDDVEAYDCAWLPTFFFQEADLPAAVARVVRAVKPGGAVVLGRFDPPPDPLIAATTALRAVRSGGCHIGAEECAQLLRDVRCSMVRVVPRTWPAPLQFIVGQR
jgi:SAM-dependent methyltransferase